MTRARVAAAVVLGGILAPTTADAQATMACGLRGSLVSVLEKIYSERPVSAGIDNSGALIEVFASESGTWTIIVTNQGGMSCLMAAGESWQSAPPPQAGLDS